MILWLTEILSQFVSGFSVFQYLTLRIILTIISSFLIVLLIGPMTIRTLQKLKADQSIRDDGPKSHLKKIGTPTMGGVLILVAVVLSALLWADLTNYYIWVLLFVTVSFGGLGFIDDYKKIINKNPNGMSSKVKYFWQTILATIVAVWLYSQADSADQATLFIPFFKDLTFYIGAMIVPLAYFVIIGSSNAVNLTDGLDGLAILPSVMVIAGLGVFAYLSGHMGFAEYLSIPKIVGSGEITIFCAALIGAGLGFLWFNTYPAMIFMGDVGSLAIGAILGTIAIIVRQELVLFIMGGVFVLETISVIIQVISFKLTGKRVFRMAPIHHHYELKGWPEPRIIVRFWIITIVLVLIGLASLKIR